MTGLAGERFGGGWRAMKAVVVLMALILAVATTGCGKAEHKVATPPSGQPSALLDIGEPGSIHRATDFSHPLTIDNKWTPMVPGTASYFVGAVSQSQKQQSHGVVSIVTDVTKVIDGVKTRVVWERDFSNGLLEESELFFVAQDGTGTVWLLGEYPAVYESGKFTGAPDTWIAGVDGARGGVFMLADPRAGTPSYAQGFAPSVEFDDHGQVFKVGQTVLGTFDRYRDVLVIDEWSPRAPEDGHQRKYYASGIGTVLVAPQGGDQQEVLSLATVAHLNEADLAKARQEVLKLDTGAYRVSKAYARTSPAVPRD